MSKNLAELLIARVQSQSGKNRTERGIAIIYNENLLPSMEKVNGWKKSGTRQWGKDELEFLRISNAQELAEALAETDSWVCMAGIAELLMQGEEEKAIQVAQSVVKLKPNHENATLQFYFGDEITSSLLGLIS